MKKNCLQSDFSTINCLLRRVNISVVLWKI